MNAEPYNPESYTSYSKVFLRVSIMTRKKNLNAQSIMLFRDGLINTV